MTAKKSRSEPRPEDEPSGRAHVMYLFDPKEVRSASLPPEDTERLIWFVLGLMRGRTMNYDSYRRRFEKKERTFRRDIAKLRGLGEQYGFAVTVTKGSLVLARFDDDPKGTNVDALALDALRAVAEAFGTIVADSVGELVDLGGAGDRFLRFAAPKVAQGSTVAATYGDIRSAWAKRARLTFRYPGKTGGASIERTVEPYFVTHHSGRYYLVAFDVRPRGGGWRQFAIDRIDGGVRRSGTFKPRTIAPPYARAEAVGFFKNRHVPRDITILLSSTIASAVCARRWQDHQRVDLHGDGSASITFEVQDVAEGVRWAFQFGIEARVTAPDEAVRLAADWSQSMARAYAVASPEAESAQTA